MLISVEIFVKVPWFSQTNSSINAMKTALYKFEKNYLMAI